MNYRHAFHAGSFADVHKHALLCRILHHLRGKPAPFRVIDSHAGAGLYDLTGSEARRSGEWHEGIERLMAATLPLRVSALLAPYLEVIGALNERGRLTTYPGSPALARAAPAGPSGRMRAGAAGGGCAGARHERRSAHQNAADRRMDRVKRLCSAERTARPSADRPALRRGARIQPDGARVRCRAPQMGDRHFYAVVPIKGRKEPDALAKALRRLAIPKMLRAELTVAPLSNPSRLNGSGLVVVNPPWTLEEELTSLLSALAGLLGRAGKGGFRLDWLAGETRPG